MSVLRQRRAGATLVVVVISMVAAAVVGTAILSVSTSSRYERLGVGATGRAYYLAESGADFVRAHDPALRAGLSGTYTLANGDQFIITVTTNDPAFMLQDLYFTVVNSTGIAHPGTTLESRQQVRFAFLDRGITSEQGEHDFYDETGEFNTDAWGISGGLAPAPKDTGPSGGEGALDIQGTEGYLYLTWNENTNTLAKESTTLCRAYQTQTNRLGYDVQVKVQPYDNPGVGFGQHYMHGISFRLQADGACYGLSFFRSLPVARDSDRPAWARDARLDANFQALRGTNDHVVLWYRTSSNAVFQLVASRRLLATDPIIRDYGPTVDPALGIIAYSTLLLQLDDGLDVGGNPRNEISAYVQSPSNCPACYPPWPGNDSSYAVWQTNATVFPAPLVWDNGAATNVDNRILSSTNYCAVAVVTNGDGSVESVYAGPPEIGIHMYYDQGGANKKFFDDLAIRIPGSGTPYGGTQIQY